MENKVCQNCKQDFTVEPEDFSFYEKIKVPPPTWCPECRMVRRMMWRNEKTLYKRTCALTGKEVISIFRPDGHILVADQEYWRSDKFEALEYGIDLDLSKPFFTQYMELSRRVPLPALAQENCVNATFNHYCTNLLDCYYCFRTHRSKNALYSYNSRAIEDSLDCSDVNDSRSMHESIDVESSELSSHIEICDHISRSHFLFNCRNCVDCFMSSNLSGKQYYFRDQKMSREEYNSALENEHLDSYAHVEKLKNEFLELKKNTIRKGDTNISTSNSSGAFLLECNNVRDSFFARLSENLRYGSFCNKTRDAYDVYAGSSNEMSYETAGVGHTAHVIGCHQTTDATDAFYSTYCDYVKSVFGCIGLQNKSYCILNKQYTKEEYEKLVPRILQSMKENPYVDARGIPYTFGDFLPPELSPFGYNETVAQDYFPIQEADAVRMGYPWSKKEKMEHKPTVKSEDIPDGIKDVPDSILNEIIPCAEAVSGHRDGCEARCPGAFKINKAELELYRIMNIPVPRRCPQCRFSSRIQTRTKGFLKLYTRVCMCNPSDVSNKNTAKHFHGEALCGESFVTPFSPDAPEVIYCEKCYKQEIA